MDIHARVLQYLEKTHPYQIRNEAEFLLIDAGKEIARLRDSLSRERDAHNRTRERWIIAHQSGTNEARANLLPQIEHLRAALSREQIAHDETRRVRNRARLDGIAEARANLTPEIERLKIEAAGYRLLRRGQHWSVIDGVGQTLRGEELDAAVAAVEGTT
jgi:hypothetical protein